MKKVFFLLSAICLSTFAKAQTSGNPQNEIKLNIANTIAIASVEFGYERFLDDNQSIEAIVLFNDRINYHSESGSRKFNTTSFKFGYNYYFGEDAGSGIYANPFIKIRTGDFTEDETIDERTVESETDMDSFIVGLGGGYKWNFNNKFVLGPFINIGRNFSDEVKDRFSAIEFNAGFQIGYRF
ncbi:autotransporter outer membrane beta-barrel domain-containing protein [Zunongwangia endophytica]|uniref:Autotransporter outer membrane beta-barrel domain-containing protein n=1 Tax=Zunongwangia endophytica TaxID=1808945 RepID=A0ABV8H3J1_9FLAO|nr:autotransporter outer membrane beta-barrel domain-containing protein [Zunongwangia endophytica]MDN3596092.1 DUF3575 domain-containing protein [Zunongwangia endophytica]